jgi:hypothetical protein
MMMMMDDGFPHTKTTRPKGIALFEATVLLVVGDWKNAHEHPPSLEYLVA